MPAEAQKLFEELMSAIAVDEYLDLKDPGAALRRRAGAPRAQSALARRGPGVPLHGGPDRVPFSSMTDGRCSSVIGPLGADGRTPVRSRMGFVGEL